MHIDIVLYTVIILYPLLIYCIIQVDALSAPHLKPHLPYITCRPTISYRPITPNDKAIVLSSDGLWDYMLPEKCLEVIAPILFYSTSTTHNTSAQCNNSDSSNSVNNTHTAGTHTNSNSSIDIHTSEGVVEGQEQKVRDVGSKLSIENTLVSSHISPNNNNTSTNSDNMIVDGSSSVIDTHDAYIRNPQYTTPVHGLSLYTSTTTTTTTAAAANLANPTVANPTAANPTAANPSANVESVTAADDMNDDDTTEEDGLDDLDHPLTTTATSSTSPTTIPTHITKHKPNHTPKHSSLVKSTPISTLATKTTYYTNMHTNPAWKLIQDTVIQAAYIHHTNPEDLIAMTPGVYRRNVIDDITALVITFSHQ